MQDNVEPGWQGRSSTMDMERYRSSSRILFKSKAGGLLIALALITLAAVPRWMVRDRFIDFPCESGLYYPTSTFPPAQRRITYCISSWPRNAFGGSVYASGESNQDEVILRARHSWHGNVTLQRDGATLIVNGRRLQKGETYRALRFFPSTNPWLLLKAEWLIGNGGLHPNPVSEETAPTETLVVGGGVTEGWAPSPLGALALVGGIALLVLGIREQARRVRSLGSNLGQ